MIIYSVEICIEEEITDEWINWMKKTHIPDVIKTNLFVKYNFFKN